MPLSNHDKTIVAEIAAGVVNAVLSEMFESDVQKGAEPDTEDATTSEDSPESVDPAEVEAAAPVPALAPDVAAALTDSESA